MSLLPGPSTFDMAAVSFCAAAATSASAASCGVAKVCCAVCGAACSKAAARIRMLTPLIIRIAISPYRRLSPPLGADLGAGALRAGALRGAGALLYVGALLAGP